MNTAAMTEEAKAQKADWKTLVGKASAGLIAGYVMAVGLSGFLVWFTPGEAVRFNGKHQLVMWSTGLFWNLIFAGAFAFRDARRAWLWLGLAALICQGVVQLARTVLS